MELEGKESMISSLLKQQQDILRELRDQKKVCTVSVYATGAYRVAMMSSCGSLEQHYSG